MKRIYEGTPAERNVLANVVSLSRKEAHANRREERRWKLFDDGKGADDSSTEEVGIDHATRSEIQRLLPQIEKILSSRQFEVLMSTVLKDEDDKVLADKYRITDTRIGQIRAAALLKIRNQYSLRSKLQKFVWFD